ncbi:hypothetical protein BS333_18345 [Vibrio azureus]|nr:hypothetical protein BS333_18345 [Vibrio azureus]
MKEVLDKEGAWTIQSRQDYVLLKTNIHQAFYDRYSADSPAHLQPFTEEESTRVFNLLTEVYLKDPNLRINIQGFQDRSISEVPKGYFIHNATSARFVPKSFYTDLGEDESLYSSRLTLNFTKEYLPEVINAFSKLYSGEVSEIVEQAKIMAPNRFPTLTDQAVLYLSDANKQNAQKVVQFLDKYIPPQAWVDHQPLGMVALAKGRNYSESSRFTFTSHGGARAVVAADAILENLFTNESLVVLLPEMLSRHGYDSKRIPLIDSSFDHQSQLTDSQNAVRDFIGDPQTFLKKYTLDVTPLLAQNGPLKGRPSIQKGADGYQLSFYEEGFSPSNKLKVLLPPLLDNTPSYIDVKKVAPIGQVVVAASSSGGTLVVTDLNSKYYRIFFDKRPHAYALYDNVVALRDLTSGYRIGEEIKFTHGLDATFFMFNEQGWQSIVQKQSFNGFSDLEVRRTGSTTVVPFAAVGQGLDTLFQQGRLGVQKQLLNLARRFGINTTGIEDLPYDPMEAKILDQHSSLAQWNQLRATLNQKLSFQRKNLALHRLTLQAKLKLPGYPNKSEVKQELSRLRASLLELDNNTQGLINLSRGLDQMWLNVQQKAESGIGALIVTDENLRTGNFDKGQIHQRFLTKEHAYQQLTGSKRTRFDQGYEDYQSVDLPNLDPAMTLTQKQLLLLSSDELDARQQGALVRIINNQLDKVKITRTLDLTARFNKEATKLGGRIIASIPQDFVVKLMGDGSGRCYPLVRAMSVAISQGKDAIGQLSNKLFIGAANPQDLESQFFLDALHNLHSSFGARESSFPLGQMDINSVMSVVEKELLSKGQASFALNTSTHSMGISAINDMGQKRFYFYDPNFSLVEFPTLQALRKGLEAHFVINGMADHYLAFGTPAQPEFKLVQIDTAQMALVEVLPGQQVFSLTSEEPLSPVSDGDSIITLDDDQSIVTIDEDAASIITLDDDDESVIVLNSADENFDQDLALKMSLTKLEAYEHAQALSLAISQAREQHNIPTDWLPVIGSIEESNPGYSSISFVDPISEQQVRVEVLGRDLVEVNRYLNEQYVSMNSRYDLTSGQKIQSFEFEDVQGMDGLNAAFAVQSVITWYQNQQREQLSVQHNDSLLRALKVHSYVMATQIVHGVAMDVSHVVNLFRVALSTDAELVNMTMNSTFGLANQGVGLVFGALNVSLNSYELAHAKNVQQASVFGMQLGMNSIGMAVGGGALIAGTVGASTTALVLGEAGALIGGLAVGFTALADAFGKIALDAQQVGHYFQQVDKAYQDGGYRYDSQSNLLIPLSGAVINRIDLSRSEVELGNQYLYSSRDGSTGSGRLNYFFWAGDLPKALRDKSKALPVRERLGYTDVSSLNMNANTMLMLPVTGVSYIDYDYEILPGATTRHDAGFDVLRRLEDKLDFDYDFYVFPSEYLIRSMKEEFVAHTVDIKLGRQDRVVITPKINGLDLRKLDYRLSAEQGKQTLLVQEHGHYSLVEENGQKVEWLIDAREVKHQRPVLHDGILEVGSVSLRINDLEHSTLTLFMANGDVWQATSSSLTLIEMNASQQEIGQGVVEHLEQLSKKHQLFGDYVTVDNYQEHGQPLGRAYYDVRHDQIIVNRDVSIELSQDAKLISVQGDSALFFNQHYGQLWKIDTATGIEQASYSVHEPKGQAISITFDAWTEANATLVSATYHMPDQSAIKYLYRLTSTGLALTDIHGDRELYQTLSEGGPGKHREVLTQALQVNELGMGWFNSSFSMAPVISEAVEIGVERETPVWSVVNETQLLKIRLEHPEPNLQLLLSDNGTHYLHNKNKHQLYIVNKNDINVVTIDENDQITVHQQVYLTKRTGEMGVITPQGQFQLIGLSRQWFELNPNDWQRTLRQKFVGTTVPIMLMGLTDYDRNPITVWYLPEGEQFVLLANHEGSQPLSLIGKKNQHSAWLFEPSTGSVYSQPMLSLDQMYNFTADLRFITDGLITQPQARDLVGEPLQSFYHAHDGYRIETRSGLVFVLQAELPPKLVAIKDRWLKENGAELSDLFHHYHSDSVVKVGENDPRWLVTKSGRLINLATKEEALWIGSVEAGQQEELFYIPKTQQLIRSDVEQGHVSLGFYEDVFRADNVFTLVTRPMQGQQLQSVKLIEADSLVLSSSGRRNSYDINGLFGKYQQVFIRDSSYMSVIDLSRFSQDQIVVQHEQNRLKLVVADSLYIVIEQLEKSSKNKLAIRFADSQSPVRVLFIQSALDKRAIDGIAKMSELSL